MTEGRTEIVLGHCLSAAMAAFRVFIHVQMNAHIKTERRYAIEYAENRRLEYIFRESLKR